MILTLCELGNFTYLFTVCCFVVVVFHQKFKIFFQEYHQNNKQFEFRSGLIFFMLEKMWILAEMIWALMWQNLFSGFPTKRD